MDGSNTIIIKISGAFFIATNHSYVLRETQPLVAIKWLQNAKNRHFTQRMATGWKQQRKLRNVLLINGYVLDFCNSSKIIIPSAIINLCVDYYSLFFDVWNRFKTDANICIDRNRVHADGMSLKNAVGSIRVSNGEVFEWNFRICQRGNQFTSMAIGISDVDNMVDESMQKADSYFFLHNAMKFTLNTNEKYGMEWLESDMITMRLDMTDNKGRLSFAQKHYTHQEHNFRDFGAAFDQIDVNKTYCMVFRCFGVASVELVTA